MDQMSAGMARLKNLASTMNAELKAQNEQLDRLDPTISRVSDTMGTQNRQMNKLLGVRGSRWHDPVSRNPTLWLFISLN